MLVHVIADYGPGDLAFAEVAQRLMLRLPDAEPVYTPVPAFATLAAGFCVAQLGLNPAPAGHTSPTGYAATAASNDAIGPAGAISWTDYQDGTRPIGDPPGAWITRHAYPKLKPNTQLARV
jgi:hypothetical protein